MRRQCLLLSRITYTPIPFWLDLTLVELSEWIKEQNRIAKEMEQEREAMRKSIGRK